MGGSGIGIRCIDTQRGPRATPRYRPLGQHARCSDRLMALLLVLLLLLFGRHRGRAKGHFTRPKAFMDVAEDPQLRLAVFFPPFDRSVQRGRAHVGFLLAHVGLVQDAVRRLV